MSPALLSLVPGEWWETDGPHHLTQPNCLYKHPPGHPKPLGQLLRHGTGTAGSLTIVTPVPGDEEESFPRAQVLQDLHSVHLSDGVKQRSFPRSTQPPVSLYAAST